MTIYTYKGTKYTAKWVEVLPVGATYLENWSGICDVWLGVDGIVYLV